MSSLENECTPERNNDDIDIQLAFSIGLIDAVIERHIRAMIGDDVYQKVIGYRQLKEDMHDAMTQQSSEEYRQINEAVNDEVEYIADEKAMELLDEGYDAPRAIREGIIRARLEVRRQEVTKDEEVYIAAAADVNEEVRHTFDRHLQKSAFALESLEGMVSLVKELGEDCDLQVVLKAEGITTITSARLLIYHPDGSIMSEGLDIQDDSSFITQTEITALKVRVLQALHNTIAEIN